MPVDGHDAAQDYVRSVLGQEDPEPETIQPVIQYLSPEESLFLEQALEKLIEKQGDKMEREYMLEDKEKGVSYRGRFTLERIRITELED